MNNSTSKRKSAFALKLDINAASPQTPKRYSGNPRHSAKRQESPLDQGIINSGSPKASSCIPYHSVPVEIIDSFYLGTEKLANDADMLRKLNITHILNVADECRNRLVHDKSPVGPNDSAPSSPMYNHLNLAEWRRTSGSVHSMQSPSPLTPIGRRPSSLDHRSPSPSNRKNSLITKVIEQLSLKENPDLKQLHLKWLHKQEDIQADFERAFKFIDEAINNGSCVLVHCKQGISRSAAMCIAYVMYKKQMKFQEAYDVVKTKSPSISPNLNLIYQLQEFEKRNM